MVFENRDMHNFADSLKVSKKMEINMIAVSPRTRVPAVARPMSQFETKHFARWLGRFEIG